MWLARTSLSDGIAVVIVATVLFLCLLGAVVFIRWISRIIGGRSSPESVILVFPNAYQEEENDNADENAENLKNFAWFIHTLLREKQLGYFSAFSCEGEEIWVVFKGTNANQIWQMIHAEAKDKAPARPLRVILEHSRKNVGQQIIDAVAWQQACSPLPQPVLPTIPEEWMRLSFHGQVLTNLGIGGLFLWGTLRTYLKLSETQFRDTDFGNYSAWIIGILLIAGLSLKWLSNAKFRSLSKQAGFPTDESSTSTILKYILLLVIIIFALVFVLVV